MINSGVLKFKRESEIVLEASGLDFTIFRCSGAEGGGLRQGHAAWVRSCIGNQPTNQPTCLFINLWTWEP